MRWFWSTLALLAALGVWFALAGPRGTRAVRPDIPSAEPSDRSPASDEASPRTTPGPTAQPAAKAAPEPSQASTQPDAEASARPAPDMDLLGEDGSRIAPPPPTPDARRPEDIVRRIDARTLELDGRFRITGNGSAEDPYSIPWELLTSAMGIVSAESGALVAPPWVRLVDGTYVEISAYYSTPVRVRLATNVLLTLNRWDGCCIGLPPTAFDAIDAAMREPIDMKGLHLIRFGTFRGRLVVEPIAAGGYLLGLYRIEDATFVAK
ncbi:MAG: hypothetical protein ACO3IB_05240 [Phycisphaerales bacterium]